jgi:hypothetical protein
MNTFQAQILNEILAERERQDRKWGEQNHPPAIWMLVLGEEVGEAGYETASIRDGAEEIVNTIRELDAAGQLCESLLDSDRWRGVPCPAMTDEQIKAFHDEMIQVAAVALSALECLYRGKWMEKK